MARLRETDGELALLLLPRPPSFPRFTEGYARRRDSTGTFPIVHPFAFFLLFSWLLTPQESISTPFRNHLGSQLFFFRHPTRLTERTLP